MKSIRTAALALFALLALQLTVASAHAQVGALLWEEEFADLDDWILLSGNGSWGWGNGELEFYRPENVDIAPVPGEPGNTAMRITARAEGGPGIVDQWGNPLSYTSGRAYTKSTVSVLYGVVEARVRVPDLDLGGWPAVWLLGTSNYAWPRSGEMDLMEMGSTQAFRNLHDTHNGGNGLDNSTENEAVGANAIFYSDAAVNPGNPSGAASLSYDPSDAYCRPYYNHTSPLNDRFLIYRVYWDATSLRFTIEDDGVEYELYETPFTIDAESDEFNSPFYLLVNMAIGGAFTDAYNLGDPGSGDPVSMSFPAEMLVDYIRVYEWNGQGSVHLGPPEFETGPYGIFTDLTPTQENLVPGVSSEIYVWESTLVDGTIPPYEGANGLTWQTDAKGWFGAGVMSIQPLNLFDFGAGELRFRIRIPANVTFRIGIIDAWGNQNYVTFPAFTTTYGLVRDGEWGEAAIPVSEIRGTSMDLRMLQYPFVILEENGTACEFGLDDIVWTDGNVTAVEPGEPTVRPVLAPNVPNPFRAATTIGFELPVEGTYELTVFDPAGRRIRTFQGTGRAGANELSWDGRDAAGRRVDSGVYFYRIRVGDHIESRKMTLLR